MNRTPLPLPDVVELPTLPSEFAALIMLPAPAEHDGAAAGARGYLRRAGSPVQVWHLETPQASVFALFN